MTRVGTNFWRFTAWIVSSVIVSDGTMFLTNIRKTLTPFNLIQIMCLSNLNVCIFHKRNLPLSNKWFQLFQSWWLRSERFDQLHGFVFRQNFNDIFPLRNLTQQPQLKLLVYYNKNTSLFLRDYVKYTNGSLYFIFENVLFTHLYGSPVQPAFYWLDDQRKFYFDAPHQ